MHIQIISVCVTCTYVYAHAILLHGALYTHARTYLIQSYVV